MIKEKKEKTAHKKEAAAPKVKKAAAKPVKAKPSAKPKEHVVAKAKKPPHAVKPKPAAKKKEVHSPVLEEKPVKTVHIAHIAPKVEAVHLPPKHEPKPLPKVELKPEIKHEPKPEIKPEVKHEPKLEVKPHPKPEVKIPVTPAAPVVRKEEKPEIKAEPPAVELKELELEFPLTVKDLAVKLQEKPSNLIKILMGMKMMVGINQAMEENLAEAICKKYGFKIKKARSEEELALDIHHQDDGEKDLVHRSPIVTLMGHVDHGKTSLLDAIRKSKVTESEHGGITQHIGAYRVKLPHGEITFLDTPGHEAFTAMRARGASITDIVILVVAADDGIMPQTQEAIDHAKAAGVPIIVAMNKIDKPGANVDMVKKQLQGVELVPEDWGGKTITVPVSAKTGKGIDDLLEMILLEAQMLELKANPKRLARGVVIEAKMAKGRGPVATLLVQNGTLHLNENIIVGNYYGKIRAMFDDHGHSVTAASPGFPVEVLGISNIPLAGEQFFVIENEKQAKELAASRSEKDRQQQIKAVKRVSLEDLHAQILEGKLKELKIIVKADVRGSLEAIKDVLNKLNVSEIKIQTIHEGVGNINSSDAILAVASNALILGFNVVVDDLAKELITKEGVDVKTYNIIYELGNDIKAAVEGMLEPKLKKIFLGRAEVRKVFKLSRAGTVAGCFVTKGKFLRTSAISLLRNGEPIFEGKLSSLKRFKDDVREVAEGFECGMSLGGFDAMQEGDIIEAYEIQKIARTL